MLAKLQSHPLTKNWKVLKRLLRYTKGTILFGILIPMNIDNPESMSCIDAYWTHDEPI